MSSHWIDAHCHLADVRLTPGFTEMIARSRNAGVTAWVQGGVSPEDWNRQLELRRTLGSSIVLSFGLHPWKASEMSATEIHGTVAELDRRLTEADALGETGLDHGPKFNDSAKDSQRLAFELQLALNQRRPKPLVLHVVRAHEEALETLKRHAPYPLGGLIHSFSGSLEVAHRYLELGFLLSISGGAAKRGFQNLKSALSSLPLDKIVIETDSPDQGQVPAELNEPANLIGIAGAVARLRGLQTEQVLDQSAANLRKLFCL